MLKGRRLPRTQFCPPKRWGYKKCAPQGFPNCPLVAPICLDPHEGAHPKISGSTKQPNGVWTQNTFQLTSSPDLEMR